MIAAPRAAQSACVSVTRNLPPVSGTSGASAIAESKKRQNRVICGSTLPAISLPEVHEALQITIAKTRRSSFLSFTGAGRENSEPHALLQQLTVTQIDLANAVGFVFAETPDPLQCGDLP